MNSVSHDSSAWMCGMCVVGGAKESDAGWMSAVGKREAGGNTWTQVSLISWRPPTVNRLSAEVGLPPRLWEGRIMR